VQFGVKIYFLSVEFLYPVAGTLDTSHH